MKILYEDNHLIAVYKPSGMLSQGDKTGDRSLMDEIKDYLKEKYGKPGNVYLGLVHRLDRMVSGVMVFAKTSKAAARLCKQIRERKFEKKYLALVEGEMQVGSQKQLVNFLKKNVKENKAQVCEKPEKGALEAILDYKVIKNNQGTSEIEVRLITGRFHQIRAQIAYVGHPIIGDVKYGASRSEKDKSIKLFCKEIAFLHPISNERIVIKI